MNMSGYFCLCSDASAAELLYILFHRFTAKIATFMNNSTMQMCHTAVLVCFDEYVSLKKKKALLKIIDGID